MNVRLQYEVGLYYQPQKVEVLWEGRKEPEQMQESEGFWYLEKELLEGEHRYKLVLDGELELTDPYNNLLEQDREGNVWSVLIISGKGERLHNPKVYDITLEAYQMQNVKTSAFLTADRKAFCIGRDRQAVACFKFSRMTGIHSVTAAWYAPDGELHEYAENIISNEKERAALVHFWIDMKGLEEKQGMWKMRLFVDGQFVLEDMFTLYSQSYTQISHQL